VCCRVLQCVAECCSAVLQCFAIPVLVHVQCCVAVCCSVLQGAIDCCSAVLRCCVAVLCCSAVLRSLAVPVAVHVLDVVVLGTILQRCSVLRGAAALLRNVSQYLLWSVYSSLDSVVF